MQTKNTKFYSLLLVVLDAIVLLLAFSVAYIVRVQFDDRPLVSSVYATQYFLSFLAIVPFWILVFAFLGLYQASTYNRRLLEWLSLIHISEPTRLGMISYAVFCLK